MWRTTLKSVSAHKRRLLATCLAVMFGVAFLSATLVVGDTMTAGFSDIFAESNAGTDAVVRNATQVGEEDVVERGLVDAGMAGQIASVDGVAAAVPEIWGSGRIVGSDGDPIGGNGPPTFAAGWISNDALNPYHLASGRAPAAPGEAVIDRGAAKEGHLAIGDTTTIRVPQPVEVTIVGLATFAGADSAGPTTFAAFTPEWASELLLPGQPGKATSIRVAAEPGVSQSELVHRIDPVLPHGVESLTGAQVTKEMEDDIQGNFLGFFTTALLVFAGVSLVVATFSIYNTFSILVAQRTRESALLRALGASRGQVLRSTVVEALAVGIVASAIGVVAGVGLAAGMLSVFDAIGVSMPAHALVIGTGSALVAATVGVIVTLIASVAPALRAARTSPMEALRAAAVDRSGTSWFRAILGVAVTGAGVVAVLSGTGGDGNFPLTGLGAVLTLVGVVLFGPVAARPVAGVLAAPGAALRGVTGSLARRNAMRNPRRTAGTASALMVGVAVVSLFTVVGSSIKASMDDTIAQQFHGDLVLSDPGFSSVGFSPELSKSIDALPEVDAVSSLSNAPLRVNGKDTLATTIEPATFDGMLDLGAIQGGSIADVGDNEVAVSKDYAKSHHLALGSPLPLTFADGASAEPTVGAIYARGNLMGDLLVPDALFLPHTAMPSDFVIMITVADGTSLGHAERAIQAVSDQFGGPDVQTGKEYVKTASGQVDQVLNLVYGLLVLAIIIALMGIANTLSLSIHERSRELGLLRAVGQTRRQLRSMVRGEAATVALFGTAGGVGLGVFLGWAMVQTLAHEGFTSFAIPTGPLAVVMVIGALVGVVAAVRPARRAARMDVLATIATD